MDKNRKTSDTSTLYYDSLAQNVYVENKNSDLESLIESGDIGSGGGGFSNAPSGFVIACECELEDIISAFGEGWSIIGRAQLSINEEIKTLNLFQKN